MDKTLAVFILVAIVAVAIVVLGVTEVITGGVILSSLTGLIATVIAYFSKSPSQ